MSLPTIGLGETGCRLTPDPNFFTLTNDWSGTTADSYNGAINQTLSFKTQPTYQADWAETDPTSKAYILRKPTLTALATNASYTNLTNAAPADVGKVLTLNAAGVQAVALSTVAGTGQYADLLGKPTLSPVATSGAYSDLSGRPALSSVATSGLYADLSGTPTLAPVATLGTTTSLSDWAQPSWTATTGNGVILGKPTLAEVATTGNYGSLTGLPSIPAPQINSDWNSSSGVSAVLNKPTIPTLTDSVSTVSSTIAASATAVKTANDNALVQADWSAATGLASILNKPTIPILTDSVTTTSSTIAASATAVKTANDNALVQADWNATTGLAVILNKPTGLTQIQSDWSQTTTTAVDFIKNKPTVSDSVTTTSSTQIASSTAAKTCYDRAETKLPLTGGTLTGGITGTTAALSSLALSVDGQYSLGWYSYQYVRTADALSSFATLFAIYGTSQWFYFTDLNGTAYKMIFTTATISTNPARRGCVLYRGTTQITSDAAMAPLNYSTSTTIAPYNDLKEVPNSAYALDAIGDIRATGAIIGTTFGGACIADSVATTSSIIAASATAVKSANDNANGRVARTGDTMSGALSLSDNSSVSGSRPTQRFNLWTDGLFSTELQNQNGTWNHTTVTRNTDGGINFKKSDGTGLMYINNSGNVGVGTTNPSYKLHVAGDTLTNGWFRTTGTTGFYSDTYGGGWNMTDTTYMRCYGDKWIYTGGNITAGGTLGAANFSAATLGASIGISDTAPSAVGTNIYQWTYNIANPFSVANSSSFMVFGSVSGFVSTGGIYSWTLDLWNGAAWVSIATMTTAINFTNGHLTFPISWVISSAGAATYSQFRIKFTGSADTSDRASIRFARFPSY